MALGRIIVLITFFHQEIPFICYLVKGKFITAGGRGAEFGRKQNRMSNVIIEIFHI